ncbi:MAG: MBL fold metallo-hydrolase [Erysipelotrichaceae bacterium]|nr:MBL fold metallo-hydrolase [Erysipelotrichaceae bacterium]
MATNNSKKSNSKSTTKKASRSSKKQSTPNYQKQAVKAVKKAAKKNPKVFLIILLVAVVVIGIGVAVYFLFLKDKLSPKGDTSSQEPHSHQVVDTGISFNFLELGNKYTGDSTYIKAGDVDILIDAGSRKDSATTIKNYVTQYCTDGTLEYVIATHAHQDHIAGFVGSKANPGIFDTFKIDTLIDFAQITQKLEDAPSQIYTDYVSKRDAKLESGDIAHHYTALQCVSESDGAKKEYTLAEGITMTILDQAYYHEKSKDENDHSVCTLFTQGDNHYLLTGDLEEKGEKSLVETNPSLPHCQLFKGGHHGSYTASNDVLLDKITPETVCICCCCGTDEYDSKHANPLHWFPAQEAIDRMAKHTDKIYATTLMVNNETGEYTSMNGNIVFKCEDGVNYTVTGSNNSTILKETDWFKANRTWPEGGK